VASTSKSVPKLPPSCGKVLVAIGSFMIIPYEQLSEDALLGLIEEFITREGTDYGIEEVSLGVKVEQVRQQLKRREVVIAFDPATESVTLLTRHQAEQLDQ